jgi:hypothetical protein
MTMRSGLNFVVPRLAEGFTRMDSINVSKCARTAIPLNPSPSDQAFVSADCLHKTEAEARVCCPEPVTKRRGWDEWAELDVVASTEGDDDFYAPFVTIWGAISDDNTSTLFDPIRSN